VSDAVTPRGELEELARAVWRLPAAGAAARDGLRPRARALHALAARVPALAALAAAADRALAAPAERAPAALLDLTLLVRQVRGGEAAAGADGALVPAPPSGPWATPLAPVGLRPLVEALNPAGRHGRWELKPTVEAAGPDLRLAGPLLAGFGHRHDDTAEYVAEEALPALAPGLAAELRRALDLRGDKFDARRLAALCGIDRKSGAELCRAALAEGSDAVKAQAVKCLARQGAARGERAALEVLKQKKSRAAARKAALQALAPSRRDEALGHLLEGLARPRTALEAYHALCRLTHPRLVPRLLEETRAAVAGIEAAAQAGPVPRKETDHLRQLLCLLAQRGGRPGMTTVLALADHLAEAVRATAVTALEWSVNYESAGRYAVAELAAALKHKEERVRYAVARLLGRGGPKARAAVPALAAALREEPVPSVREAAVSALGDIGEPRQAVLSALCRALRDERPWRRGGAAQALGRLKAKAGPAVPTLLGLLRRGAADQRCNALDALGAVGPVTPEVVPAVVAALRDPDERNRGYAANALIALGVRAKGAVPALVDMLHSRDGWVRWRAVGALGKMGRAAAPAAEALAALLQDRDAMYGHYARPGAAEALAAIGPAARAAVPALLEARKDRNKRLRAAVDAALAAINR
jgi:HEAT repeat protein